MALTQRNTAPTAPFDAALPYTTAAALSHAQSHTPDTARAFDITGAKARLCGADGGYETVHESQRLQICVYALVAPEPDHRRVNADDEIYIVLEGSGTLEVDGEQLELREGQVAFVPAGAEHSFSAYEHLTVLAILEKGSRRGSGRGPVPGVRPDRLESQRSLQAHNSIATSCRRRSSVLARLSRA